jgi:hypothetical protein
LDWINVTSYMKKLAEAAGDQNAYDYWNNMTQKGIEGALWYLKKEIAFNMNDLSYKIGSPPSGDYAKYCLALLVNLFSNETYMKTEIEPYVWALVNNYIEDDKNNEYAPVATNFAYEIPQILYTFVWNNMERLRQIESNWSTYYPTGSHIYDIRAFRLYMGRKKAPLLDETWHFAFTSDKPDTEDFGCWQLNKDAYYIENSTDSPVQVTVTITDRNTGDSYNLSNITDANELITNTTLAINNYTVTITVPERTFRIVKITY